MPLLTVSASYALFSQDLSVDATGSIVSYISNQYMTVTYTKSATLSAGIYTYRLTPLIVKNNGVTSVTAWQVKFTVPADMTTLSCPTSVVCSTAGTVVTMTNGTGNGTIAKGATRSISNTSFKSAVAAYTPQNIIISGTFATTYATIAGFTVAITRGTSTQNGSNYTWTPVTVTVTNNSGQPLSGWQLAVTPWASTSSVGSTMPTGLSYATTSTRLTITSTNAIAAGSSYQFTMTITNRSSTWTPVGALTGKA
jgi:head-tail adaptor